MTPVVSVPVGDMPELLAGLPGCAIVRAARPALAGAALAALPTSPILRSGGARKEYSSTRIARQDVAPVPKGG